jgi:hypothetical protein
MLFFLADSSFNGSSQQGSPVGFPAHRGSTLATGSSTDFQADLRYDAFMSEAKPLDRARIEEAFRIMGQYLLDRKALGEIAIYGGSAILFQFDWRKSSQDVDARIGSDGSHGLVIAVREAAKRLGLSASWLDESVAMYTRPGEGHVDRVLIGLYPSPERFGLRVMAAKPAYIPAMKLKALERMTADDRDYRDAVKLGIACGATTADGLRDVFRKFFPDEALPLVAELRLGDLAQAIQVEAG